MPADRIEGTARDAFGFAALRPGQREAIEALLTGRDTLAVLASGAGKSAIYQIAALLIDGPTLVISPLIALQQDQSEAIERHLPGEAAPLNSRLGAAARRRGGGRCGGWRTARSSSCSSRRSSSPTTRCARSWRR